MCPPELPRCLQEPDPAGITLGLEYALALKAFRRVMSPLHPSSSCSGHTTLIAKRTYNRREDFCGEELVLLFPSPRSSP